MYSQDEDSDGMGVAGMDRDYQNNHTTRRMAPKQSSLQSTNKQVLSHLNAPAVDNLEDLNEVDINSGRCHHTKKAKCTTTNRDATNVGFYPPLWQKLLDCAKAKFRLHIATSVPFPDKEESIGGTRVCGEVIIQWQEQKCKLEKGYYPEFKTGMVTVVFNDAATFCSKIKQIVLTVIPMAYELALGINRNMINSVKLKATGLLKKAMYLCGHPDSEQFAEFHKTISPAALFLIGNIVNGAKQTPIKDSETSYNHISMLFDCMNKDAYHRPKLCQMLKVWALEGMNIHGAGLGVDKGDNGSEWDVDLA
ncbi:hypothetical protein F4604DRAFT_1688197 [Suillus subluteus]|nr:hypothetical protein F4604DRAFT_1688197 [Suillus subluteus]